MHWIPRNINNKADQLAKQGSHGHNGGWTSANETQGANVNQLASSNPEDWEQVSGSCFLDGIPVAIEAIVEPVEHA